MSKPATITADEFRRLFFAASLLDEPTDAPAGPRALAPLIKRLGFVQLDTISIVERAHHHILWTRRHTYKPATLDQLQRAGQLFEHFTHDASLIPSEWFPQWRHRFARVQWSRWFDERLADRKDELLGMVRDRIRTDGPLLARDFEDPTHQRGTWWDWKPAKAALEYLWRTGELAIARREGFEKIYDLTERVLPVHHATAPPDVAAHIDWACSTAIERLGAATAGELAAFWKAITPAQAREWAAQSVQQGTLVPATIQSLDGAKPGFAIPHWKRRQRAVEVPDTVRLLSPFDPLIRDRERCRRFFGFHYRFEAFVPGPKRKHGYYVLPILNGSTFIGRLDPKLDRATQTLHIRSCSWEPGVRPTKALRIQVEAALERYAAFCGAKRIDGFAPIR